MQNNRNVKKFNNLVLIHGRGIAPWFEWLQEELYLQGNDINVIAPILTGKNESYEDWKNEFERQKCDRLVNKSSLFLAHSMGSQFIVKYLNEKQKEIGGYISVAAPHDLGVVLGDDPSRRKTYMELAEKKGFGLDGIDFGIFKNFAFPKTCIFSSDKTDETFAVENMRSYAEAIGAVQVPVQSKKGHFKDLKQPEIIQQIKMHGVLGDDRRSENYEKI